MRLMFVVLLLLLSLIVSNVGGVLLSLLGGDIYCLSNEFRAGEMISGSFKFDNRLAELLESFGEPTLGKTVFQGKRVIYQPLNYLQAVETFVTVRFSVNDPQGKESLAQFHQGPFSFVAAEEGIYQFCFKNHLKAGNENRNVPYGQEIRKINIDEVQKTIALIVHQGKASDEIDSSEIATRKNLEPIEQDVKKIEDIAQNVLSEFSFQSPRAEEIHSHNESTHSKISYLSILSFSIFVISICVQLKYLKTYFRHKKVID